MAEPGPGLSLPIHSPCPQSLCWMVLTGCTYFVSPPGPGGLHASGPCSLPLGVERVGSMLHSSFSLERKISFVDDNERSPLSPGFIPVLSFSKDGVGTTP